MPLPYKSYLTYSYFLLSLGIFFGILNLINIGSIPLFSSNQNEARAELQKSILWNAYIFLSIGIFIFSFSIMRKKASRIGWFLLIFYILLALMSGWKGVFLNFIFLFLLPRYKNLRISASKIFYFLIFFILIFVIVNGIRSQSFYSAFGQPIYYIYWGFINFDINAIPATSECLHSVPIFGCKFFVDNSNLLDPTWNVYTALSPLYIDGGIFLITLVFFLFGFFSGYFEKTKSRLTYNFIHYASFYFLFFSHNGYLFYSSFYISALIFLIYIEFLSNYFTRNKIKTLRSVNE